MLRRILLPALAALTLVGTASAQVSSWAPQGGRDREEQRQHEVPFSIIQSKLRSQYGGQLLDAQRRGDTYIVSWITEDGHRLVIEVDAETGRILSTRGR